MIKVVKVVCFDALLQVLILKGVTKGSGEWPLEDRGKQVATCKEGICHPDQVGAGAGTESTEKDRNAILEAATKVRSGEWNPSHNALKARKSLEAADSRWERHGGTPHPGVLGKEAPSC